MVFGENKRQSYYRANLVPAALKLNNGTLTISEGVVNTGQLSRYRRDPKARVTAMVFKDAVAPTDASGLFSGLASLKSVQGNLDTNTTVTFSGMFKNDTSLVKLGDMQYWLTNNVTSFNDMFSGDAALADIRPLAKWNVNNGLDFSRMFYNDKSLLYLRPVGEWNVSNAVTLEGMFAGTRFANDDKYYLPLLNDWWFTNNFVNVENMFKGQNGIKDSYYTPIIKSLANKSFGFTDRVTKANCYGKVVSARIPVVQVICGIGAESGHYRWLRNEATWINVKGRIGNVYNIPIKALGRPDGTSPAVKLDRALTKQRFHDAYSDGSYSTQATRISIVLDRHGWLPFSRDVASYNELEKSYIYPEAHGEPDSNDNDIHYARSLSSEPRSSDDVSDGWTGNFNHGLPNFCIVLRYCFKYYAGVQNAMNDISKNRKH